MPHADRRRPLREGRVRRACAWIALLALMSPLLALGCAPRKPFTEWGYSSWFRRGGPGEMGTFERQRAECLREVGIDDPTTVSADSPEESRFLDCMNAAAWCTDVFGCQRP